jgi:hypothetical protein
MVIWYIFPVLVYCTEKNLATLTQTLQTKVLGFNLFLFRQNQTAKLPQGPFVFSTPTLTPYRQQLWIDAQLVTKTEKDQVLKRI